jgi:oxaloacetate decarboxylase gamma subunit
MLEQSGVLTLLGMGIVFTFLVIMIIAISRMGKLIHFLGLDKDIQETSPHTAEAGPVQAQAGNNAAVTAAIAAAVNEYRKTNS